VGGHDLRYGDGRRGDEGNNLYPVHYARALGDLLRSEGKAPVTFSRAGFTGSQAHGVFWAGDEDSTWDAFRSSVTAGITASACGIVYWGWDLAGFSGPVPGSELYLRAVAAATVWRGVLPASAGRGIAPETGRGSSTNRR
jgi:alpha-glucosidase (family GH31 glycosyl hydrolase)